jgi:hypothetical protein
MLLVALAALITFCVLLHPAVHWRLYGWERGEPFWRGRPACYWREQIGRLDISASDQGMFQLWTGCFELCYGRPLPGTPVERALDWFERTTGLALPSGPRALTKVGPGDPAAVPVLVALLGDPDPRVRAYAADELGVLGVNYPATRAAVLPALRRVLGDRGELPRPAEDEQTHRWALQVKLQTGHAPVGTPPGPLPKGTVGDIAAQRLHWLETGQPFFPNLDRTDYGMPPANRAFGRPGPP